MHYSALSAAVAAECSDDGYLSFMLSVVARAIILIDGSDDRNFIDGIVAWHEARGRSYRGLVRGQMLYCS